MPGRMKGDLVDPVPEAVVGPQLRRVLVRLTTEALCVLQSGKAADLDRTLASPLAALARQRFAQNRVRFEDVVVGQRLGLIGHCVGLVSG